jgi:hypothetical protein
MAARPRAKTKTFATSPSRQIDGRIRELGGWRGETLARMRALVHETVPAVLEEWKWGTPVWSHHGIICTGEAYTRVVKLTFAKGASLADPAGLFNSSLDGNTRRAIDIREGEKVNARAFKALVRAAAKHNSATAKQAKPSVRRTASASGKTRPVRLLSGGNPQIAKGDGDLPVQAYIAALSGWQHASAKRLDALIERTVRPVQKAVKWNSPFYGRPGEGWFLVLHTYTRFLQLTFFRGTSLRPMPAQGSKVPAVRYHRIHEGEFDEAQLRKWVTQAAELPGWVP